MPISKGPWTCDRIGGTDGYYVIFSEGDEVIIGKVLDYNKDMIDCESNARAITCVPEMLELLKAAFDFVNLNSLVESKGMTAPKWRARAIELIKRIESGG